MEWCELCLAGRGRIGVKPCCVARRTAEAPVVTRMETFQNVWMSQGNEAQQALICAVLEFWAMRLAARRADKDERAAAYKRVAIELSEAELEIFKQLVAQAYKTIT